MALVAAGIIIIMNVYAEDRESERIRNFQAAIVENLLQSKSPQKMYIEAGIQERKGYTSNANKLYEAIIDRFPKSDFAVKASDKLTSANRAERAESNRRSQSQQECENNKNACLAGCGTYISGADSHNNAVWSCNDKCKQISCY